MLQTGDINYDLFIRIHTFNVEEKNLADFNELMDIVDDTIEGTEQHTDDDVPN
jgi:hypothetical protein